VNGNGTIRASGGQATFSINAQIGQSGNPQGNFAYTDTPMHFSLSNVILGTLTITGNQAHLTGTASTGPNQPVNFTVDVTDNGTPGTRDMFSISLSNNYSAKSNVITGNVTVQH